MRARAPIGALLDDELGRGMVLMGTTRSAVTVPTIDLSATSDQRYTMPAGDPGVAPQRSLDALLDTAGVLHLTDLRRLDPNLLTGSTAMQGAFGIDVYLDPQRTFDAVVHSRHVTEAHGIPD